MKLIASLFYVFLIAASCGDDPRTEYVIDRRGLLTDSQKESVSDTLKNLHKQYGPEFLLLIDTIYPDSTSDISTKIFNQLSIGRRGLNDGVLLYINTTTRTVDLRIGYGLEWSLPQVQLDSTISVGVQYFSKGRYFSGIMSSINYLTEELKKVSWSDCESAAQNNCIQKIKVESVTLRTPDSLVIVSDSREKYVV
jgi:uncharacterized membrane protein YgcG